MRFVDTPGGETAKVWLLAAVLLAVGAVLYLVARTATRRETDVAAREDETV